MHEGGVSRECYFGCVVPVLVVGGGGGAEDAFFEFQDVVLGGDDTRATQEEHFFVAALTEHGVGAVFLGEVFVVGIDVRGLVDGWTRLAVCGSDLVFVDGLAGDRGAAPIEHSRANESGGGGVFSALIGGGGRGDVSDTDMGDGGDASGVEQRIGN